MHRNPEAELLPLDTELERTLRNLRKVKSAESATMAEQREIQQPILVEAVAERPHRQMTMEDFWRPVIQDESSTMRQLAIEANNFELKLALITMVQQHYTLDIQVNTPMSRWEDFCGWKISEAEWGET